MVCAVVLSALQVSSSRQVFWGQRQPQVFFFLPMFDISPSSKCAEHTRALLVFYVLEENTHYNNCPIAYSDFIKTYLCEHNYTFSYMYLTTPPRKSIYKS